MRMLTLPLFLSLASTVPTAVADTDFESTARRIGDAVETCIGEQYSTPAMTGCANQEFQDWDAELNRLYRRLMDRLDQDGRSALRTAQRAWLAYRDAEYANIDGILSTKRGTMYQLVHIAKYTAITEHRVEELSSHMHTLDN